VIFWNAIKKLKKLCHKLAISVLSRRLGQYYIVARWRDKNNGKMANMAFRKFLKFLVHQWWWKIDNSGGGLIFIYSCSQTLKTIDFKRN
jgi:hypothetical protein